MSHRGVHLPSGDGRGHPTASEQGTTGVGVGGAILSAQASSMVQMKCNNNRGFEKDEQPFPEVADERGEGGTQHITSIPFHIRRP